MFVILIISALTLTNALKPASNVELANDKIRDIISQYITAIPDIKEQYVVDERLSRAISHYFKGKISSFPLYKISLKIDRNPVKIPWTLGDPYKDGGKSILQTKDARVQKHYKYEKPIGNSENKLAEVLDGGKDKSHVKDAVVHKDSGSSILPAATTEIPAINTTL